MTALGALTIVVLLILPLGFGASFAVYPPSKLTLPARLALGFAGGYAITALCSYALILAGVFYATLAYAVLAAATVACWVVAWRRTPLPAHARGLRLRSLKNDPSTIAGLCVIAAIAALAVPVISAFHARIPFRYWVDGLQIARLHEIPAASIQYGDLYPTVSSKVLLDAFTAVVSSAVPQAQVAVGPLLWVATVGTALALWAVAREAGLVMTAPLLPVLIVANPVFLGDELTIDLFEYRAEAFGRLVAFAALAFGVRAVRTRTLVDASVAGLLLAAAAGTHLVPALFVCLLVAGFVLATVIADRSRRMFTGLLRTGAIVFGGAAVGYGLVLVAPDATGLGGPSASDEYGGYPHGLDPTAYLANVSAHPASGAWYRPPWQVVSAYFTQALDSGAFRGAGALTLVLTGLAALAVAVYVLLRSKAPPRLTPLACWTAAAASILIALYFARRYEVYTLATFGMRRLFDYGTFLFVLAAAAVFEIGIAILRPIRTWLPLVAGLSVTLVLAAAALTGYAREPRPQDSRAVPLLSWVRTNTPCDARLLMNARTVGVFQATTGRTSVTEGMGPFLRPVMLRRVVRLLMKTKRFYADPASERQFLLDRDVDYVIVLRNDGLGLGGLVGLGNVEGFRSSSAFQSVYETSDFAVFKPLNQPSSPRQLPRRFPCRTTPLR
jgi:hypothetical protein